MVTNGVNKNKEGEWTGESWGMERCVCFQKVFREGMNNFWVKTSRGEEPAMKIWKRTATLVEGRVHVKPEQQHSWVSIQQQGSAWLQKTEEGASGGQRGHGAVHVGTYRSISHIWLLLWMMGTSWRLCVEEIMWADLLFKITFTVQ